MIEFLSNNRDSTFCKFHLPPIHVANTLPFPLLAVLRMNSQAITQYCKVPQGFGEAARRPAQSWAASLSEHAVVLLSVRGGWKVNSIQIGQQQLIVPCHMRMCQEDEHGHRTETFSPKVPSRVRRRSSLCNSLEQLFLESKVPISVQF